MLVWYPAPGHEPTHPVHKHTQYTLWHTGGIRQVKKTMSLESGSFSWSVPPHSCSRDSPPANKLLLGRENMFITPRKFNIYYIQVSVCTYVCVCEYVGMCTHVWAHAHTPTHTHSHMRTHMHTMTTWPIYSSETFLNTHRSKSTYL